jgi:phosphoglucomutase
MDDAYMDVAACAIIDKSMLRGSKPEGRLHEHPRDGGDPLAVPLLVHAGCYVIQVTEQMELDPRFPTVKSPNPENAEALSMAVATADRRGCDVVMATDPDCDRMGVAVRGKSGKMELLTGNQIGSLIAEYRLIKYKELGWIPKEGSQSACIIKTFVTTSSRTRSAGRTASRSSTR